MNWNYIKKDVSKLSLILSLIGILLIAAPFLLIWLMKAADANRDTDTVLFLGAIMMICTIPMALVVVGIYGFVLISTITSFTKGNYNTMNIMAFAISVIAVIVTIGGVVKFLSVAAELIDTISRLG